MRTPRNRTCFALCKLLKKPEQNFYVDSQQVFLQAEAAASAAAFFVIGMIDCLLCHVPGGNALLAVTSEAIRY